MFSKRHGSISTKYSKNTALESISRSTKDKDALLSDKVEGVWGE